MHNHNSKTKELLLDFPGDEAFKESEFACQIFMQKNILESKGNRVLPSDFEKPPKEKLNNLLKNVVE